MLTFQAEWAAFFDRPFEQGSICINVAPALHEKDMHELWSGTSAVMRLANVKRLDMGAIVHAVGP